MAFTKDSISGLIQRTFDIREGEMRRAMLMQLNIFLLISSLLIIKPTINSLFLTNVGISKLPLAFIFVAVGAGIIMSFYSRMLRRTGLNKIIRYTLIISVITISVFAILLKLNYIETWILYLFYVWVAVFGVLSASQFWILANIVFNAREAKRLFGIVGSGAIIGGIFGGYLASLLAPLTGSENLLFVGGFLLLIAVFVNKEIWKSKELASYSWTREKLRADKIAEHPIRLIKNSKHLTYLTLITILGVLVARLIDYQFSAISSSKIPDEDELTSFFGFWFSNFNILSLLIQLFLTRKVVGVLGVGMSLFFLPSGILIGAVAVLFVPGLYSAIFIKLADGSLKQSINKSAIELLALPIPTEVKNQAKTFIDVVVDSLATGLSGLILIFLINGFDFSTRFVSIPIILLILLWFYFARKVRREYLLLFKDKLKLYKHPQANEILDVSQDSVYGGLKRSLESGSEKQILFILNKTEDVKHERLFESIRSLLKHDSAIIRAEALKKLYHYKSVNINSEVSLMVHDGDYNVKVAAIEYLIQHNPEKRNDIISKYLNDNDYRISGATLLSLVNEVKNNVQLKELYEIESLIEERKRKLASIKDPEELKFRKLNLLKIISQANISSFYSLIPEYFNHADDDIVIQAIISGGITSNPGYVDALTGFLKTRVYREAATKALENFGSEIVDHFYSEIEKPDPDYELISFMPKVLENLGYQSSVNFLFDLLQVGDSRVKAEALISLVRIKVKFPHLVFNNKKIISIILDEAKLYLETLSALYIQQIGIQENAKGAAIISPHDEIYDARKNLIALLESRLDGNLERIFKLLELKYPPDDMDTVYRNIKSDKTDLRVNAIEFLDNLLEVNLKKILIPIIETFTLESITKETLKNLNIKITDQFHCFELLLKGQDVKVKLAVFYLISKLKEKKYIELITPYSLEANNKVKNAAIKTIQDLNS